jgi:hypothetical protein
VSALATEASADRCSTRIPRAFAEANDPTCVCGKALKNIVATVPPTLRLVAACGLRWPGGEPIDISARRITLDAYSSGNIPYGVFFFEGRMTIEGKLRYEPGPAGYYWFEPRPALLARRTPLSLLLATLQFEDERELERLPIPRRLRDRNCLFADATLRVDGIRLVIADTDEQGPFPFVYKVLHASTFRACPKE